MNSLGMKIILDKSLPTNVDIQYYVNKLHAQSNGTIERINFTFQSDALLLRYRIKNNPFECIVRISTEDMAYNPAV